MWKFPINSYGLTVNKLRNQINMKTMPKLYYLFQIFIHPSCNIKMLNSLWKSDFFKSKFSLFKYNGRQSVSMVCDINLFVSYDGSTEYPTVGQSKVLPLCWYQFMLVTWYTHACTYVFLCPAHITISTFSHIAQYCDIIHDGRNKKRIKIKYNIKYVVKILPKIKDFFGILEK